MDERGDRWRAVGALAVAIAVAVGACSPGPPSAATSGAPSTFPLDAFAEPGPGGELTPSTTSTSIQRVPVAGCPGPATCLFNSPGEPLDLVGGKVIVEYRVNPAGASAASLTSGQVVAAIRAAAAEWARHDGRIELVYRGTTSDAAGTPGVFAFGASCGHGAFPACTDRRTERPSVTFSSSAPWTWRSCGPGGDGSPCTPYPQPCTSDGAIESCVGIDLQAVATHEWGHILGLDDLHSRFAEGLTMYARAAVSDDQGALALRDLSTIGLGDLTGLRRLYPGSTTNRPILTP